jgi:hypothetical protein
MLERGTNLFNLIEASEDESKSNSFQEWIFGQANWACLSYWDLKKVEQEFNKIITGYFCSSSFSYHLDCFDSEYSF